jgi:hypothetical protein
MIEAEWRQGMDIESRAGAPKVRVDVKDKGNKSSLNTSPSEPQFRHPSQRSAYRKGTPVSERREDGCHS